MDSSSVDRKPWKGLRPRRGRHAVSHLKGRILTGCIIASAMIFGGVVTAANAPAATVTSARTFKSTLPAGRADLFAEVSRGGARKALSTSVDTSTDWGGIGDLDIPYSKSTAQNKAADALSGSIRNGQALYDSSAGMASGSDRSALKDLIGKATALSKVETTSENDLNTVKTGLDAAIAAVEKGIESYRSRQAAGAPDPTVSSPPQSTVNAGTIKLPSGKTGNDVVSYAMQFVGKSPYVWGGSNPGGWDCSGMVMYVYAQFGISLPHWSDAYYPIGNSVSSLNDARPGDVIVGPGHVGIFIGNGAVVNALNPEAGTAVTPIMWAFPNGYQIRRIIN
jgi:cell wall-associated NlpC family hydrolase